MYGCMSVVYRPAERVIDLLYGDYQQKKNVFIVKIKNLTTQNICLCVCMYYATIYCSSAMLLY